MITRSELVPWGYELTERQHDNVTHLLVVMNRVRAEYGLPMRVTSGFRSHEDQIRINPKHPESLHTRGMAVDIYDPDPERFLWMWCMRNLDLLTELGLYIEAREYSDNHVHFQTGAPHSGQRIFIP